MLDYTKAAILKIQEDLRKLLSWANLIMQLTYIGYLIYAICTGAGVYIANLILLALSLLYFAFFVFMSIGGQDKLKKKTKKIIKLIYTRSKQIIKFFIKNNKEQTGHSKKVKISGTKEKLCHGVWRKKTK